jgi:hypothetical protein
MGHDPISGRSGRYGVRMLHVGDAEIPGPELFWMREWDAWFPLAFQCALIQSDGVTALVSTGPAEDLTPMNDKWAEGVGDRGRMRRSDGQFILDALQNAGVDAQDVTHVILTPLQLYTTSNVPRFPDAAICMSRKGWVHYQTTHSHPHDDRWFCIPRDVLTYVTDEAWDRVRLLDDTDEIVPGIRTWWAGSHHRASIVVEVDTPAGVVTITDAYFVRRNLEENHPIGICENIYEAMAVHERVKATADHPLTLYDPGQLERYPDGIVVTPQ